MPDRTRTSEIVGLAVGEIGIPMQATVFRGHSDYDWRAEIVRHNRPSFYIRVPWNLTVDENALVDLVKVQIERTVFA